MKNPNALALFKCLADASRLQILKSLCKEAMYVEQLAERLGLSSATISNHLKKLEEIGAVQSKRAQYYTMYALCGDVFAPRIIDLIRQEDADPSADAREAEYRQKILVTFIRDGKIERMPAQLKKKIILVEEIACVFEAGTPYSEKEMNLKIADFYDDFCMVRRFFVDYGLFTRENNVYIKQGARVPTGQMPFAH
ncbi:MAG: metalloregulator ArsR/SmtB family transcription factor [Defluviitaleaceae bacterium]|nr:metalloregulator ArsR/SmtB family transcription factor [Defluviitaleaceae bacterium]MCL2275533.1 metalloregulator ArsR/SmtB family transcription factor [Defluviitaleaceae bacterium]